MNFSRLKTEPKEYESSELFYMIVTPLLVTKVSLWTGIQLWNSITLPYAVYIPSMLQHKRLVCVSVIKMLKSLGVVKSSKLED